jgi:hypothetical protein
MDKMAHELFVLLKIVMSKIKFTFFFSATRHAQLKLIARLDAPGDTMEQAQ